MIDQTTAMFYAADKKVKGTGKVSLKKIKKFFQSLDTDIEKPDEIFLH